MSNTRSQSKQKLSDVAKDLGISNQELIDFVENKFGEVKKAAASLTADQLNIILENYTQNNQVESFDGYFAKRNEPKPVKKEEPKQEKKPAKKDAPKAEQPKQEAKKPVKKEAPKAEIKQAIDSTNAKNVFVLPNNTNIILAAQQAAGLTDRNVMVLPTKSVPMGISAAIAFSPDATPEENLSEMNAAAERVHTASITYAVRDTVFDGREIHANDIMGMVDNRIRVLGSDVHDVALEVVDGMVTDESSVITVYYGSDIAEDKGAELVSELEARYPDCEVDLQKGGQPLYYYLISIE